MKCKKPISQKMIIFFTCIAVLLIFYTDISFRHKNIIENVIDNFIYALVLISGIGGGLKLGDDIQRSLLYNDKLVEKDEE